MHIHMFVSTFLICLYKSIDIRTPDRLQSKTLLTIDERGSKIVRNSYFENSVLPIF